MYDAGIRWPRLTQAIARYMAGPVVTGVDLAGAAETVGDYVWWQGRITAAPSKSRAWVADDPSYKCLRGVIKKAVADRHRFNKGEGVR
jgi:hypothetical protein